MEEDKIKLKQRLVIYFWYIKEYLGFSVARYANIYGVGYMGNEFYMGTVLFHASNSRIKKYSFKALSWDAWDAYGHNEKITYPRYRAEELNWPI